MGIRYHLLDWDGIYIYTLAGEHHITDFELMADFNNLFEDRLENADPAIWR